MPQPVSRSELVLSILHESCQPLTAYQILEIARSDGVKAAPTIYRALEWLQQQGHIQRIESSGTYFVRRTEGMPAPGVLHCESCGDVREIEDETLRSVLQSWSDRLGYRISHQTVELIGKCRDCDDMA
jgi:Fur family transcriptional regulator, zinc uptake regulator